MSAPADWPRVKALFAQALDLPEADRARWIAEQYADDAATLAELRSLLAAQSGPHSDFLSEGGRLIAPALAARGIDGGGPAAGARIGPYRLLHEIGAGGMGRVFLAERADGQFNRQVALKVIRSEFASPELLRRFLRERETLARLAHPNIATLHDGGVTEDDAPYFTMEFVEGERIDRWCDERRLDVRARVGLVIKICDAVQYAHRNLVVHRDIKPSNIIVTPGAEPKLLDFGIAKPLATDAANGENTGTQAHPMTREYAAPEQVLGASMRL
ncbi:MAG TPA: serine/threonine-protein kinase [Rhodanobacteraceae bacterium]|nr:serine/threonine-protein kinase [Rhodanobacteraceae bacterium]